jgi:hypothetical protein
MNIKEARKIAANLSRAREWTASDYKDSIDTSGFLILEGCTVKIDWERIDRFADEVAARAIMEYVETKEEVS